MFKDLPRGGVDRGDTEDNNTTEPGGSSDGHSIGSSSDSNSANGKGNEWTENANPSCRKKLFEFGK